MAVWVSFGRSSLEAAAFLETVRDTCSGRLPRVFIDGNTWYPWALDRIGFKRYTVVSFGLTAPASPEAKALFKRYTVVSFGYGSAIERFFGDPECRIRRFWNGFIGNYNIKSMQLWIEAFAGFRNCIKDSNRVLS